MAETIKVRICVAVSADGNYDAVGWAGAGGQFLRKTAMRGIREDAAHVVHWVTAELPLPTEATVQGKVVDV